VDVAAPTVGLAGFAQYSIVVEEELYLSPLVWGRIQNAVSGLSNINNLTLNFRIDNWQRAIRCVPSAANSRVFPSVVTVSSVELPAIAANGAQPAMGGLTATKAILDLNYITPDPVLAAKMPSVLAYDYSYIQSYITPLNTTGPQLDFQSIRLPSIPKRMFVYAKPSKRVLTGQGYNTIPDIFLRLTNIQITFNNRINLLANDTEQTLYTRSVANGLKDSWVDWRYNTGSILCLDIAKDFGLEADETSGQSNKYSTLQVRATFDTSPLLYWGSTQLARADFDAYIVIESPGKAFVTPSDCQFVLTGPSSAEVLALTSSMDKVVDHSDLDSKQVGGGAFGLGKLFKSGLSMLKNVNPEHVAKGVEMAQKGLSALGMGVAGGAMKHKRVY